MASIIDISGVTMKFRMANDNIRSLKEFVVQKAKRKIHYNDFVALDNVSLSARRGEVIGLIGNNGAGKSTLLKIISGILTPTEGTVAVHGHVVPMLELGSGFDPDMTGRENVFLNGAILGYSEQFLNAKYDEIIAFSELEDRFINMPLRNYSSGMKMRLAFSVATVIEPEILIVDEILSVGDARFSNKSLERMMQLMSGGTTVLLVSHSIKQIRSMCNRVLWLEKGQVKKVGTADEVCNAYESAQGISTTDEI